MNAKYVPVNHSNSEVPSSKPNDLVKNKKNNNSKFRNKTGTSNNTNTPRTKKPKRNTNPKANNVMVKSKLVIRKIPYDITEEMMKQVLQEKDLDPSTHLYRFQPGKIRENNKGIQYGVAFLSFKKKTSLIPTAFAAFEDFTFTNSTVPPCPVKIEYAPYQKLAPEKIKLDPKNGALDSDADFLAFVENLKNPQQESLNPATEDEKKEGVMKNVPLVEFLLEKRAQRALAKEKANKKNRFPTGKVSLYTADKKSFSKRSGSKGRKNKSSGERGKQSDTGGTSNQRNEPSKRESSPGQNFKDKGKYSRKNSKSRKSSANTAENNLIQPGVLQIMPSKKTENGSTEVKNDQNLQSGRLSKSGKGKSSEKSKKRIYAPKNK